MSLRVAVQMDPLDQINISGDSTFAIMLGAQARGHRLFHYLAEDLTWQNGRLYAGAPIIHQNGLTGSGFATLVPHFLQVRRASSFQNSSIAWLKCSTMSPQSKSMSSTSAPQFSQ